MSKNIKINVVQERVQEEIQNVKRWTGLLNFKLPKLRKVNEQLVQSIQSSTTRMPSQILNKNKSKQKKPSGLFFRVSAQDQILLAKRLGILLKGGVPLLKALNMMKDQASSKSTAIVLEALVKDVEGGQYLSVSLAKYKKFFTDFSLNIIRVGEISGTLQDNLNYLAEELKKKQELKRKVIGALVYPIFIVIATFGVTGLLTIYVFPKILPIFKSFNFPLPFTTRALMFFSSLLLNHWLIISIIIICITISLLLLLRIEKIKLWFDRQIFRIPVFGKLFQNYNMANFCRTTGILLKSNVFIVEATNIAAQASRNLAYRKEFKLISKNITQGAKMSRQMEENPKLFPPMLRQMVAVGESTGNLSESLLFLAGIYEDEIDELINNLSHVIEPVLMILMGVMVGFVAVSIITPIYSITQTLRP